MGLGLQIFLKCRKGWKKMKCRSWKKLRHGTEHANGWSCTFPLQNSNSPCLSLFCKHQEIGFCFKGAASKHPDHQRCALTWINKTLGEISTAHPRWGAPMSMAQVNLQEVREREQHKFCQLAKQRSTDTRSKKPRVVRAWAEEQHFPNAGNLPGYSGDWYTASDC